MYRFYCDDTLFFKSGIDESEYYLLDANLSIEKGKVASLSFTIPHTNIIYDSIQKLKSIVTVYDNDEEIFRGRVLYSEKDFYNNKNICCEGELAFLLDSVTRPYEHQGSIEEFLAELIRNHNLQVDERKRFVLGNVTVEDNNDYINRSNAEYDNTYNTINKKLIESHGGYIKTRGDENTRYIDYVEEYGKVNEQTIEFGVNLLDIKEYITAENIFTCLIPLGKKDDTTGERLTIKDINGVDYIENDVAVDLFGRIFAYHTWDDVTVATNLLRKGRELLDSNVEMAVTLTLKAIDLHLIDVNTNRIKVGDKIRVISKPHNIDKYFECTKIDVKPLKPSKNEYTFGNTYKTLTDPTESLDDKTVVFIQDAIAQGNADTTKEIANIKQSLTQEELLNIITDNGKVEGIYLVDGQIWIDGTYIKADSVVADSIKAGSISVDKLNVETREMIETANSNSNEAINGVATNTERIGQLELNNEQFKISVEEIERIANANEEELKSVSTQLQITKDDAQFLKTKIEEAEKDIDGKIDAVTIEEWARFDGSRLELGASNSPFKAILSTTELGFWQGENKVAWFSNNELHVLTAVITTSIGVGTEDDSLCLADEGESGYSFI